MSLNILVVDDCSLVRTIITRTLKLSGVPLGEVHEAGNGREGLDVLEKYWIDLVFVDINMPVMDGEAMIEQVRSNPAWADLPLVVISTEGSQARIERLTEHGATFIHKPFTPEKVSEVVGQLLRDIHERQDV